MRKLILLIIFFLYSSNTLAKIDIHFSKVNFYLNDQTRTDVFDISNLGNDVADCSIGLTHYRVFENGDIQRIKEGLEGAYNPANKLIRYSPRSVKISGQSKQAVRLSFRRLPKLKDDEYVSFLSVGCTNSSKGRVGPIINHNLPVVIRHGIVNSSGKITSAKLIKNNDKYSVEVIHERLPEATASIIGNYQVIGKESGDVYATLNKSKIYPPAKFKKITLNIKENIDELLQLKFVTEPELGTLSFSVDITN